MTTTTRDDIVSGFSQLAQHLSINPDLDLPYLGMGVRVYVNTDAGFRAWHDLLDRPAVTPDPGSTSYDQRFIGKLGGLDITVVIDSEKVGQRRVIGMVEQVAWTPPATEDELDRQAAAQVNAAHQPDPAWVKAGLHDDCNGVCTCPPAADGEDQHVADERTTDAEQVAL